jgi:protein PhnA
MAKGYDQHQERQAQINMLGKQLARRSHSSCELCGASEVPLSVFEVPPEQPEPTADGALFLCGECRTPIDNPRQFTATRWHFLTESVWSDIPAVQVMAVRLLRRISDTEAWAAAALEDLYLDDEIEAWIAQDK